MAWVLGAWTKWKICVVGLNEYIHDICGKVGWHVCKLCFMNLAKFCGYEKFCGYGILYRSWNFDYGKLLLSMRFWLWQNRCWVCDIGSWTTFVVMILDMKHFSWLWFWTCRNFFFFWLAWDFGMEWWAKFLCCKASRVEVVSKCWGHLGIFWTCDFGYGNFFWHVILSMKIFGHVILVMENFWTCDFGHGKFFGHDFGHGKFLIMWKL